MASKRFKPNLLQLCLLIFLLVSFAWNMYKIVTAQKMINQLKNEIETVQKTVCDIRYKQQLVEEEIARWNDPKVIEEFARKELGFVRPGEVTYMFSEGVQPATDSDVANRSSSSREGIQI